MGSSVYEYGREMVVPTGAVFVLPPRSLPDATA